MKRLFLTMCLLMPLLLNACQCSWKPDVGPVENEEEATTAAVQFQE